jgi:hemoglobin-like flavoprotein
MALTATALSPATRELVRASFPMVERIAPRAGTMFYGRLFATAPEVLPQFRRDLSQPNFQPAAEHRFMQLVLFVRSTAEHAGLPGSAGHDETVGKLAQRHVGYTTLAPHYVPLGRALLWTLEQCLGAEFTPAMRAAWSDTYDVLVAAMVAPLGSARR